MSSHAAEDPAEMMLRAGIKPTANRILILRTLLQEHRPLSMIEIEDILESVDKSIISRTLSTFRAQRLLHTLEDGGGSLRYEVCHCGEQTRDTDRHVHFHCEVCGKTYCFEDCPVPQVAFPDEFDVHGANYIAYGICPACRAKR